MIRQKAVIIETPGMEKKWGYSYASDQLARFHEVLRFYVKRSLSRPRLVHAVDPADSNTDLSGRQIAYIPG